MRTGGRPTKDEGPRTTQLARVSQVTKRKLAKLAQKWGVPFAVALDRAALPNIDRIYDREFSTRN
jgi:hypothetical protein